VLRRELLKLDVESERVAGSAAEPPRVAKSVEAVAVGALVVTAAPLLLRQVLKLIDTSLRNRPLRTVKVELDALRLPELDVPRRHVGIHENDLGDEAFASVLARVPRNDAFVRAASAILLNRSDLVRFEPVVWRWPLRPPPDEPTRDVLREESREVYAFLRRHASGAWLQPFTDCARCTLARRLRDRGPRAGLGLSHRCRQLQAFAAPRRGGIWSEVREEIASGITQQGGVATEVEGPLGWELWAQVPVQLPNGKRGIQVVRFAGVDGPRWFLRGVISGQGAVKPEAAGLLEQFFKDTVVVRGDTPMAPRDPITLKLPEAAQTVPGGVKKKQAADDGAPASRFTGGPDQPRLPGDR
jgi:hypothetical protein